MPDVDDSEHNSLQDTHNDDNDDNDNVKLSGDTSDHQPDPGPASAGTSSTPAPVLLSDTPSDRLPSPITINSTCTNDLSLMPSLLSPILRCPLCKLPFISPTTLHCGHTICSTHLQDKCPIPSCHRSDKPLNPNIPQSSTVTFSPAESPPPLPPPTSSSRVDVTISKIISLVSHVEADLENIDEASDRDDDDHDDDDAPTTPFPSSSSRVRPRRNSSASPPRVRKRRRYTQKSDDEDDLLSHLRKQSVVQRSTPHDEPLLPSQLPSIRIDILSRFEKNILTELTCDICCTLFYQPLTTPCQHTFCSKCLHRALDHSSSCPICRQNLPGFSYFQDHPENKVLLALILKAFPTVYRERGEAIEAEEREARLDTPIFVCQLSFPGMPTLLHFFEPRYRLMLRRCLESPNPRFGMVMAPRAGASPHDYGTMLEIRQVQMLPDGRSVVETWGTFRFRLLESGMMDGYMVGRIERIDDYPEDMLETVEQQEDGEVQEPTAATPALASTTASTSSIASSSSTQSPPANSPTAGSLDSTAIASPLPRQPTNEELMDQCRTFLDRLQRGTAPWVVQRLRRTYGTIPIDPSSFSFWVAFIIPIEEQEKAKLLPIRSARLRLLLVTHWIEQLDNNWYKERILINCIVLLMVVFSWVYDSLDGLVNMQDLPIPMDIG